MHKQSPPNCEIPPGKRNQHPIQRRKTTLHGLRKKQLLRNHKALHPIQSHQSKYQQQHHPVVLCQKWKSRHGEAFSRGGETENRHQIRSGNQLGRTIWKNKGSQILY